MIKSICRFLLFWLSVPLGGEFYAESGTLWCRFLLWVYDEEDVVPVTDGWEYPEPEATDWKEFKKTLDLDTATEAENSSGEPLV